MKIRYIFTFIVISSMCCPLRAPWNPFSGNDWKNLGNKIKSGFNKAGDKIKEGFNKGIDKTKACSQVVALGSEWAAKQAAFQTAKGVLKAAETLQKTDPRLVGLLTAEKSAEAALIVAQGTLDVAQKASEGIAKGTKLMGDIVSKGFNVESMSFTTTSEQLLKSEPIPLRLVGTIAGKHFDTTIKDVDFSNAEAFISSVLKNLGL